MSSTPDCPVPLFIVGAQQIAVSSSVVALTVPRGTFVVWASVSGATATGVRMGQDDALPTVSSGLRIPVNEVLALPCGQPDRLRFIRDGANDATLDVLYLAESLPTTVHGQWHPPS